MSKFPAHISCMGDNLFNSWQGIRCQQTCSPRAHNFIFCSCQVKVYSRGYVDRWRSWFSGERAGDGLSTRLWWVWLREIKLKYCTSSWFDMIWLDWWAFSSLQELGYRGIATFFDGRFQSRTFLQWAGVSYKHPVHRATANSNSEKIKSQCLETTGIFLYRFPMFPLSLQGRLGRPTPGAEHDDQGLTPKKWSTEFEEENAADIVDIEKGHLLGGSYVNCGSSY